jgi:exopolysaccharide production protein ExoQ
MSPSTALLLWLIFLTALLWFDPAKSEEISLALWVPVTEFFIIGSRLPSAWLGVQGGSAAQAAQDGNGLDRAVYLALIFLALAILASRSFKWGEFVSHNLTLCAFLLLALISMAWSDYPFVAFKRWFRDAGQYLMALVVLSDPKPLEAIRTLFRRLCFLLIPLSIVMSKYFPELAKEYDVWTGQGYFVGATTSKNMLGLLCLVSGIFFLWDTAVRWPSRKDKRTKLIIGINVSFFAMTLWLLNIADSATSRICLAIGSVVLVASQIGTFKRHPKLLLVPIPIVFLLYLFLTFALGIDLNAAVAVMVGRDPTLTGRTDIWDAVLSLHTNPILGTGYESFWLGPRLQQIWAMVGGINEAHNGYLQTYLNLGFVGVGCLVAYLAASYATVSRRLMRSSVLGSLGLTIWTVLLFYNVTEAAMPTGLLWMALLPATLEMDLESGMEAAHETVPARPNRTQRYPKALQVQSKPGSRYGVARRGRA